MLKRAALFLGLAVTVLVMGCGSDRKSEEKTGAARDSVAQQETEPDVVAVQHILIGFQGSLPGKPVNRSKEEARELAGTIFEKARSGEDFDALVKMYTDDSYPGIYRIANFGVTAELAKQVYSRGGMVPAFGNIGFSLKVGEVGMALYDEQQSPFGWHIIKRVE